MKTGDKVTIEIVNSATSIHTYCGVVAIDKTDSIYLTGTVNGGHTIATHYLATGVEALEAAAHITIINHTELVAWKVKIAVQELEFV